MFQRAVRLQKNLTPIQAGREISKDQSTNLASEQVAQLRSANREVTEDFVREHCTWMLALAQRMLNDHSLAEDVVQEAFANIFLNLDKFEERASIKSWMHRIVVNQCLMALRKRSRSADRELDELLPNFDANGCRIEERWDQFETPETLLQSDQARAKILAAIETLPDKYRLVLLLRDIEELSTSEVAEILEISASNVKVRLHRGRSALKKLLEPMMRGEAL